MLSAEAFNRLPLPRRWAILEDYGTHLHLVRFSGRRQLNLFALDSFYCEVSYNADLDKLLGAQAFRVEDARLDQYLQDVNIAGLLAGV
ncbi:hypothetical protein [Flaviaesturariibacter amylovorans]|uniref:Uncharacterized protein n=1 Tax=Flaviaesturariibacter amylovorans TaxID=1084520 RepID=A0ABP8GPK6_9BACT